MNIGNVQNPYEAAWQKFWGRPGEEAVLVIAPWTEDSGRKDTQGVSGTEKTKEIQGDSDSRRKVGRKSSPEECQTCKERKYQDESDDMGVSFQTATNIAPEQVASAVRGHENEHVVREQAKAQREDRRVVSQSVTLHSDICPECGKVYISGGTTRTVTAAEKEPQPDPAQEAEQQAVQKGFSVFG